MTEPEDIEGNKAPGDNTNNTGHSEGFYDIHPESNTETEPAAVEPEPQNNAELNKFIRRKSIVAFSVLILCMGMFALGFVWVIHQPQDQGVYEPLRKVLNFNEKVNKLFYRENHLTPTYPRNFAEKKPRVNGDLGMDTSFKVNEWKLYVVNIDSHDTLQLNMDSIKKLPKTEVIYNFKCIEGWSQVTFWAGVRFSDFVKHYHLGTHSHQSLTDATKSEDIVHYAGFETPDDNYYVGLDMASAMHPQTLLCYEMNGRPLPYDQGAPLRLIVPVKYGVKSLKRIGLIFFSDSRPADYWYEQGYDYDASL